MAESLYQLRTSPNSFQQPSKDFVVNANDRTGRKLRNETYRKTVLLINDNLILTTTL